MGLSADQARYLFITARMNDIEAGMMRISADNLRLADETSDIEERRDYELNLLHMEFNGNANFTYDDFMGENAMNNGQLYFLTTNDGNNRVVLNQRYADGIKAAGIAEEGGEATQDALIKYMGSVAGKPQSVNDWKEVITGVSSNTDAYKPVDNFKTEYGVCPEKGLDYSKPITHEETYYTYSYKSNTDFAKMLGKANLAGGYGDDESNKTVQGRNYNNTSWESIAKGQQSVLYLGRHGNGHKDSTSQYVYGEMKKIINNLGSSAKSAGMDSKAVDKAVENVTKKYTSNIECIGKTKYVNVVDASKNKTGIYSGRKGGSHDRWYTVDLKPMFEMFYNELKSAMGTAGANNNAVTATENKKTVIDGYEPIRNQQGKTYEEWTTAWNKVIADNKLDPAKAEEYRKTGVIKVEVSDEDKQKLENYKQIFLKACSQGWTQDNDLGNTNNLSSKLENMQYKVNNEVIKNLKENFQQVKTNDEQIVNQRYNQSLREIERKEKVNELQQTSLQTELSALQTEEASVKSMIDKNIERGFNLFG